MVGYFSGTSIKIISTANKLECYTPGQLLFERYTIYPNKHTVDWELLRQKNRAKIKKYNICESGKYLTRTIKSEIKSFSLIMLL